MAKDGHTIWREFSDAGAMLDELPHIPGLRTENEFHAGNGVALPAWNVVIGDGNGPTQFVQVLRPRTPGQ